MNTSCHYYSSLHPDPSNHILVVTLFAFLYSIVFIVSMAGNLGVIYATIVHKPLQTVQNIFIVNLAVSGVILSCLSIPLTPVTHIAKQWFFGSMLCQVVGGTQAVGTFIGTFSLCAIAVDRYFRLVIAPATPLRKEYAVRITVLLWLISIAAALPYVYHMKIIVYGKKWKICGEFCTEKWGSAEAKQGYTIFVLIIQFFIPFTIIAYCYKRIFSFLRRRAENRLTSLRQQANILLVLASTGTRETTQHKDQLDHIIIQKQRVIAQKRRTTLILVSMVFIFGISSLPHNIVSTLLEFTESTTLLTLNDTDFTYIVSLMTHFMAMLSCVTNPLLYAFLNPEFRELVLNSFSGVKWANQFVSKSWHPTQTTIL